MIIMDHSNSNKVKLLITHSENSDFTGILTQNFGPATDIFQFVLI